MKFWHRAPLKSTQPSAQGVVSAARRLAPFPYAPVSVSGGPAAAQADTRLAMIVNAAPSDNRIV